MNLKLKFKIIEVFFTQADFALKIHENESLISRVIHGRRDLPDEKKKAWAKALECDAQEIFN